MDDRTHLPAKARPWHITAFEAWNVIAAFLEMFLTQSDEPVGDLIAIGVWLGLVFWITRGRSRFARVVFSGLVVMAVVSLIGAFLLGFLPGRSELVLSLMVGVQIAAMMGLLWSRPTSAWMKAPA